MKNRKLFYNTLIFSLVYVFLGTLTAMVGFPKYEILGFNHNSFLWLPLVVLTLPVNILLFGLLVVDNSLISIFLLQTIVFFILWFILYMLFLYHLKINTANKN